MLNRHIASSGNLEARDFFVKSFKNLVGLSVSTQVFAVRGRQAWNVIATFNCETPDAPTVLVTDTMIRHRKARARRRRERKITLRGPREC